MIDIDIATLELTVKLTDYGMAQFIGDGMKIKATGGTLVISPPEIVRKEHVDLKAESW